MHTHATQLTRPGFRWSLTVVMAVLGIGLAGCSEAEPTEFTDDTRSGFMAACSDQVEDSDIIANVCECVFESTQEEIVFTRFATIDQQLIDNPDSPLSSEVTQFVAECVITEADL